MVQAALEARCARPANPRADAGNRRAAGQIARPRPRSCFVARRTGARHARLRGPAEAGGAADSFVGAPPSREGFLANLLFEPRRAKKFSVASGKGHRRARIRTPGGELCGIQVKRLKSVIFYLATAKG
jgi:hypothetical protein